MQRSIVGIMCCAVLVWASPAVAGDLTSDDVSGSLERGKTMVKEVPVNPHMTEAEKEAQKVLDRHNSDEYQRRIKSEVGRIQKYFETGTWDIPGQDVKAKVAERYYKNPSGLEPLRTNLAGDERIYILISSSVPLQTLRNYGLSMERAKDSRVKMVLRGFVEEPGLQPVQATKKFVHRVLTGQDGRCASSEGCQRLLLPTGIQIDPFIFRRFNVASHVPAIVYARGVSVVDDKVSEGGMRNMKVKESYVLHGDVSLEYAIELFQRNLAAKGKKSPGLDKLLAAVRTSGGY